MLKPCNTMWCKKCLASNYLISLCAYCDLYGLNNNKNLRP